MPYILVRQEVEDYIKWKPVFDDSSSFRRENGSKGRSVFSGKDNPKEVVVLLEWDHLGKAREFIQSDELREAMQKAGVVGKPDICI
jgi:heme-degrading monooxygenase HmoA